MSDFKDLISAVQSKRKKKGKKKAKTISDFELLARESGMRF